MTRSLVHVVDMDTTNATAVMDDPRPHSPCNVYPPGRVRYAWTFEDHAESSERAHGTKHVKSSLMLICLKIVHVSLEHGDSMICNKIHLNSYYSMFSATRVICCIQSGGQQVDIDLCLVPIPLRQLTNNAWVCVCECVQLRSCCGDSCSSSIT